jgi:hypothetical protein
MSVSGIKSRMKFFVAAAMLGAAVLGFAGDASAEPEGSGSGSGTVIHMCLCRGSCKLVTHCLLNYCYSETICDDCANCHKQMSQATRVRGGYKRTCVFLRDNACVTNVTARRWF